MTLLLLLLAQPIPPPPLRPIPMAQGGTGAGAPIAGDYTLVTTGVGTAAWAVLVDCDGSNKALNYRAASNSWACNTFSLSGGYATVQNEGSDLTQRDTLNFVGAISCVDDTTRTTCTVSSGGGTSPLILSFGGF